jgi:hypothetical protein
MRACPGRGPKRKNRETERKRGGETWEFNVFPKLFSLALPLSV